MGGALYEYQLGDFTGGLNLDRNQFSLGPNESSSMLNVIIDARVGVSTRKGWTRWNSSDVIILPTGSTWNPKNAFLHRSSSGGYSVFVTNGTKTYVSAENGVFSAMGATCEASPHVAAFAAWGDFCYVACGSGNPSYRRSSVGVEAPLPDAAENFNDNYTTPLGDTAPRASLVEAHNQYLFWAGTKEGGTEHPNRIRWSHPGNPEDYHSNDYIDIEIGGDRITAIQSFQDHLVIFKSSSVWALYGYGSDSWQLIQVHRSLGSISPATVGSSPDAVYFYSPGGSRPGVYAYVGDQDPRYLTDYLSPAFEGILLEDQDDVFLGWAARRLWVSVPWNSEDPGATYPGTTFVWDPDVGNGAWSLHRPALGRLGPVVERAEIELGNPAAFIHGSSGAAALLELTENNEPVDAILSTGSLTAFEARYRTPWVFGGEQVQRKKSFLRPTFLIGNQISAVTINVDVYGDPDEDSPSRQQRIEVAATGNAGVWGSFNWGGGTLWSSGTVTGSKFTRTVSGRALGVHRAVSLEFSTGADTPGKAWQVDGAMLKYRYRNHTT